MILGEITMKVIKIVSIVVFLFVTGCTPPPKFVMRAHDPLLDKKGGVVVLVDTCVKRSEIGGDNYVMIHETTESARALGDAVKQFLSDNEVKVRTVFIPFICGAVVDAREGVLKVANQLGGDISEAQRPFQVAEDIKGDAEYVKALGNIGTYVFQEFLHARYEKENFGDQFDDDWKPLVTKKEFRAATTLVATKLQAASILYVGASGVSESAGVQAMESSRPAIIATLTAIATAGAFIAPLRDSEKENCQFNASLINTDTNKILWANSIAIGGNPAKTEFMGSQATVGPLLIRLVRKPAEKWSVPR